jgi:hypothetical protein
MVSQYKREQRKRRERIIEENKRKELPRCNGVLTNIVKKNILDIAGKLGYEYIGEEIPVFGTLSYDYTKRGVMDYLFKQKKFGNIQYTLVEAELCQDLSEIWSSFKVLAYKSAFCLDRGLKLNDVKCMVFLHSENYHPNIRNIMAISDVKAIFFNDNGEITKICE